MRVLVTGATGFVGRWLLEELQRRGHEPIPSPPQDELDVTDPQAARDLVDRVQPGGIVHLAGVAYAGDAASDPDHAVAVNEGGTRNIVIAAAALPRRPAVVVSGSSEVYGLPRPEDLPLTEDAPTEPSQPYGRSKLAQERAAISAAQSLGVPLIVTRSFNHTGPGQRPEFVAPALARRVLQARASGVRTVKVGNIDVRRDISDVRDVVRAYCLVLERLAAGPFQEPSVLNVGSGTAIAIRDVLDILAAAAGVEIQPEVDPQLVRATDPPLMVADASRLRSATGWRPEIPLRQTLRDLVASLDVASAPG